MTTLVASALLQASVLAAPGQDYTTAVQESLASGRPLVVLLGADWCPACKVMRDSTLPKVAQRGGLEKVEFAYVDVDRHPQLTSQLSRGRSIPQLIRFEKKAGKWNARHLIGGHSVQKVKAFVNGEPEEKSPLQALPVSLGDWQRIISRK